MLTITFYMFDVGICCLRRELCSVLYIVNKFPFFWCVDTKLRGYLFALVRPSVVL